MKNRPSRIYIAAYDPFDNKFLGSIEEKYNPRLAIRGYYSRLAKRLLFAAKMVSGPALGLGIRKPKLKVRMK